MKTLFQKLVIASLFIACCWITACQHQESSVTPAQSDELSTSRNARTRCSQVIYYVTAEPNARNNPLRPSECESPYYGSRCLKPRQFYTIPCLWSKDIFRLPCPGPGCPEDLFKRIDWWTIPDFRTQLGDPDPEPNVPTDAFLFKITNNVMGIQFYAKGPDINQQKFTLKNDLVLPQGVLQKLQVVGKVIPAGNYPVIYNPKSNIFNALVTVK